MRNKVDLLKRLGGVGLCAFKDGESVIALDVVALNAAVAEEKGNCD